MNRKIPYVVVTPVRDEVAHIRHTVESMTRQTILPLRWVIVDDGSTDGTSQWLDEHLGQIEWITVLHRADRGFRANGGGVMDTFHAGLPLAEAEDWQYLVKLDADLSFDPDYFERCFSAFALDPTLGIAGGLIYSIEAGVARIDSGGDPPFHVRGATKIYRRNCWSAITPLIRAPGWDTLDEVRANQHGWTTRTLRDLVLTQHKPTGGADGAWRDAVKNGRANYLTGYHPVFMVAKCLKRLVRRPLSLESFGLMKGYLEGYLERRPQLADQGAIEYLRD